MLRHFTPGRQWPYHGLTDRVFLNSVCETMVWSLTFRVENVFVKKKFKKTQSVSPWYGNWQTGSKTWLRKNDLVYQTYGHWRVKEGYLDVFFFFDKQKCKEKIIVCLFLSKGMIHSFDHGVANSDKKLNVNKPCVTLRKTSFWKFCKIFCQFSRCHKFW